VNARIDHDPEFPPARQLPLTTFCAAIAKRSANGAFGFRSTVAFQVPEYSALLPTTFARHEPDQPLAALIADHPPRIVGCPLASSSVQLPDAAPVFESTPPVHVPARVRPVLLRALHVLSRPTCRSPLRCEGTARADAGASDATSMVMRKTLVVRRGIIVHPVRRPRPRRFDDVALDAAEMASTRMDPAAHPAGAARRQGGTTRAGSSGRDALVFVRTDSSSGAWLARVYGNATTQGQ